MKSGTFEIDGVEYPDADASDPVALGWMQGSPPPPQIVATPSVSPDGGKFRRRVMVTLTDITPGTTIYYTRDGSDPTTTSLPYLGAFRLRHSATVKTIAVDSSGNESGIATALFTIKRRH